MTAYPELVGVWDGLRYEINRATVSLLCLLRGMESAREFVLPQYNSWSEEMRRGVGTPVAPSYLATAPALMGASVDLNEVFGVGGETEQLAFAGWVEEVYNTIWEGRRLVTFVWFATTLFIIDASRNGQQGVGS